MAAPTVVGSTASTKSNWGSSITVTVPGGTSSDTTLLVFITGPDWLTLSGLTAPSGWTTVATSPALSGPPVGKWFKRAASTAPASSYNFTKPSSPPASAICLAVNGVDSTNPINASVSWDDDSSSTNTLTTPSRTTTADGCLAIFAWAATPYQSGSEDDQWNGTVSTTDGVRRTITTDFAAQQVAWQARPTAGATGTRTGTFSNSSGSAVGKMSAAFALLGQVSTGAPQTIATDPVTEVEVVPPSSGGTSAVEIIPPRTNPVSYDERVEMIEASRVTYSLSTVEVLSEGDEVEVANIAGDVTACRIEHGGFRNIHRIISIDLRRDLDWGRQRIKPYLTVSGSGWTDTIPLGVFCLTSPTLTGGERPAQYSVEGYDKMYLLDQPLARPVSYPLDQPILGGVRDLLSIRGIQSDRIDNTRGADLLTEVRTWGVEQGFTYLQVINDLLQMVGYRNLRIDRDGYPESGEHAPADQRNVMWRYNAQSPTTTLYQAGREKTDDFTDRPNRWVFWRNATDEETPPEEGDGLYIVDNLQQGSSSQSARGGLVITRAEAIEALTQSDLETNGNRIVAEDMSSSATVRISTSINPYHDHQDIIEVIDLDLGIAGPFEAMTWSMDVFARTMAHELRSITGGIAG